MKNRCVVRACQKKIFCVGGRCLKHHDKIGMKKCEQARRPKPAEGRR